MDGSLLAVIIPGVVVIAGGLLAWELVPRHYRRKFLINRADLNFDQIYSEYFIGKALPKELACELWNEIASALSLPAGKLRPSDRFDNELAAPKGWEFDDNIVDVQFAAEHRLRQSGIQGDLSAIKTVGDYVEFFCHLAGGRKHV
jgi:hypothetical protein